MSLSDPLAQPVRGLDVSPLTEPVDEQQLRAFVADAKAQHRPWSRITTGLPRPGVADVVGQLIPVVVPLLGVLGVLYVGGGDLVDAVLSFTRGAPFPLNLVVVGFLGLIALGVLIALVRAGLMVRRLIVPRSWWVQAYRIIRFADRNRLRYGHDEPVPHAGIIFGTGADRVAERRLSSTSGRRVEIGNYRYTIRGERPEDTRVYGWGYVAITLDRRLPHLLLDAKANNRSVFGIRASNLPVGLARDQQLSLGGEFDDRFTLYAPTDYGRDAFYVFTPDLMALFIDRLGTFDVEIVDDQLFVYGGRFDLLDPRTYAWLEDLVEVVVARTVRRTERYADDFAALETSPAAVGSAPPDSQVFALAGDGPPARAANTVAERGRRLRRRTWGFSSVVGLLLIAFWVYNELVAPLAGLPRLER